MARLTRVNALSGLHLISTVIQALERQVSELCQCPLGLIPHFYEKAVDEILEAKPSCQCPLGLIPHFYGTPSKT